MKLILVILSLVLFVACDSDSDNTKAAKKKIEAPSKKPAGEFVVEKDFDKSAVKDPLSCSDDFYNDPNYEKGIHPLYEIGVSDISVRHTYWTDQSFSSTTSTRTITKLNKNKKTFSIESEAVRRSDFGKMNVKVYRDCKFDKKVDYVNCEWDEDDGNKNTATGGGSSTRIGTDQDANIAYSTSCYVNDLNYDYTKARKRPGKYAFEDGKSISVTEVYEKFKGEISCTVHGKNDSLKERKFKDATIYKYHLYSHDIADLSWNMRFCGNATTVFMYEEYRTKDGKLLHLNREEILQVK